MVHSGHGVADFCLRHASEQYKTCSQFLAQDLRQVMSRPQTRHGLEGKLCLLPLNDCACFMGLSWGPSVGCHRRCAPRVLETVRATHTFMMVTARAFR
jgi:hypothetical protein